jgi:hypothetical protein
MNRQLNMKLMGGFQNTPIKLLSSNEVSKCPFSQATMKTLLLLILKRYHQVYNAEN